jgi:hypothetical protein
VHQPNTRFRLIAAVVTVAGGALAIVGSVLPWVKVTLGPLFIGLSRSAAGTSTTRGKTMLALGGVLVLAGVAMVIAPRKDLLVAVAVVAVLGGLAGTALATYDIARKSQQDRLFVGGFRQRFEQSTGQRLTEAQVQQIMSRLGIKITLGTGLYLAVAGGLVAAVGGVLGLYGGERMPGQPETADIDDESPAEPPPRSA